MCSLVGRNLPDVTPSVAYHSPPVTIRHIRGCFERDRTGRTRAPVDRIGIRDVDIQECVHRLALGALPAHHHDRLADAHLRGRTRPILAEGTENVADEFHEIRDITHDDPRHYGWRTLGPIFHHAWT